MNISMKYCPIRILLAVFLFFLSSQVVFGQEFPNIRKRLSELSAFQSIIKLEDKDWSYASFQKTINDSNGAFLRANPRPTSTDIKKDLLQEVFYFLRMQSQGIENVELDEIKERLYKTLAWWLIDKPQFRWTDSALDQPRYLGTILILLYDTMKADLTDPKFATRIKRIKEESADYLRYTWNFGKADDRFLNLGDDLNEDVQRMGNVGYRLYAMTAISASLDREDLMAAVSNIAKNQIRFHINSGQSHPIALMPDFAFHQHNYGGSQIYNLGYGLDWFNDFVAYAYYVKDTKWALTKEELKILSGFLQKGIYPFFLENGQLVQQALGRHNQVYESWIQFPETRAKLLRSFFAPNSEERLQIDRVLTDLSFEKNTGFHSFYSSDFLIADVKKYAASVRLVSDRTSGQESGDEGQRNGMQNFFSSDGSFFHYFPGLDRIKGAWDWRKVPGTTTAQIDIPLPLVPYGKGYSGYSSYSGVLSSFRGGMIAANLRRRTGDYQLEMVKSYLLLPDLVLFWGFGLKYDGTETVLTTITQELFEEGAMYLEGHITSSLTLGEKRHSQIALPVGIWNSGNGYLLFPVGENQLDFQLSTLETPTQWELLDQRNSQLSEKPPLLSLAIIHQNEGKKMAGEYFYLMVPDIGKEDFIKLYNLGDIDFSGLGLSQLNYSGSNLSLVKDEVAWFVNFRQVAESKFSLGTKNFVITGLIAGSVEIESDRLKMRLAQMEKRNSQGQEFSVRIDNFESKSIPSSSGLLNPINVISSQDGLQFSGNTAPKYPLEFGSTFQISFPLKYP